MQLIKQVIQLAKDRALIKFSALTRLMVKDADNAMVQALSNSRSGIDQRNLTLALQFLRQDNGVFLGRMDALFRDGVERAMRTMYTDLRQGLNNMSANTLSLIDDETVNRQLEVGHLVQRLRDACDESLGRLNIMIAQIHGDPNVSERENPFRPFLMARALHEVLKEKVPDGEVAKVLFAHLSNSLAIHLSDYYASICEVFDASGIQARLMARPTKLKRHQRDQLAQQLASLKAPPSGGNATGGGSPFAAAGVPGDLNPRIMPSLQRMFDLMQKEYPGSADSAVNPNTSPAALQQHQSEEFQDFFWRLFNQAQEPAQPGQQRQRYTLNDGSSQAVNADASLQAPASRQLLEQLDRFQQQAANGQPISEQISPEQNQLFSLGDKLSSQDATQTERIAIDVVAMLFEFILEDEQIPAGMRVQIARLQIPFLKAAMLAPELLHQAEHPARLLLNRMSSAAIGLDPATSMGQQLDGEIARLVKRILAEFDKDVAIFTECLQELQQFLEEQLRNTDAEIARSVQAVEDAEKFSALLHNTGMSLREIVAPLNIDQRIVDFIVRIWARVLVRASLQDAAGNVPATTASQQYRDVLPELVWSVQEKQSPEDRNALIRLLPGLVKRLKIGMLMIHLSEDECKIALDQLVAVHTQVLRANQIAGTTKKLPSLDELRKEFTRLVMSDDDAAWTLAEPFQVHEDTLETALAARGVEADLDMDQGPHHVSASGTELLTQIQVGTSVQCWAADTSVLARVSWISKHHSLFIFKMEQNAKPLVYSAASLANALQEGKIRLVEYAPAFDRAMDALMMGAEALQTARR